MRSLTNTEIGKLEPQEKEYVISDTAISKLKIRVSTSGSKIFYLFWKKNGKQNKLKLGKFGDIGLPAARKAAEKELAKIALGENPLETRKAERVAEKQSAGSVLRSFLDTEYYPWCEAHQKVPARTRQVLEFNFKSLMNLKMGAITRAKLDSWSRKRVADGIKPATINRASSALVAVFNKAVEWQFIDVNPIAGRKRIKLDSRGVVRYLSEDEETRLLKALEASESEHIKLLIPILLNTGARPVEALSLTWDNVDLANRRITLQAAFTKTGQTRHVPINEKLYTVLSMQDQNSGFLFTNEDGTGQVTTVQKSWGTLRKAAKLENFRLYDCRHTFASKLVMRGIDIYTVSQLLGHSSVEMTKVYAHLAPEHLKSAVDAL